MNSPTVMLVAVRSARSAIHSTPPRPSDAMNCTTGLLVALRGDELHVAAAVVLVDLLEVARFLLLRVEHLDDALAVERFLGDARDVAHRGLDARAVAAERAR